MNDVVRLLAALVLAFSLMMGWSGQAGAKVLDFLDSIDGSAAQSAAAKDQLEQAAERAYEQGRFQEAVNLYSRVIQNNPDRSSAFSGRGMAHEMLDRHDRSIQDYKRALEIDPRNYRAMECLAGIYERGGQHIEEAIGLYRRARELDPRAAWKENLAAWIAILETRLNPHTESPVACWHLAGEKEREGKTQEAESLYSRSIQLDPRMYQAYYGRALLRSRTGNARGALEDLDAVVGLYPGFRGALIQRAALHEQSGNTGQALEDLKMAASADPRDPAAHYHLGRMLEQRGDLPQALESYLESLECNPKPDLHRLAQERVAFLNTRLKPAGQQRSRARRIMRDFW